jgi:hypothetical protein
MNEDEILRYKYLKHARPHTKAEAEELMALYRKYIDNTSTSLCASCGGILHNMIKRLGILIPHDNKSKG